MILEVRTNSENYEIKEIAKSLFCMKLTVGLMLYPADIKSIGGDKIEVLCKKSIGRASDSFVWSETKDLQCYSYDDTSFCIA